MNNIDKTQTIEQIVIQYPFTVDVLNKYKIDYSFKGDLPLDDVLKNQNLSEYDVIGDLDLSIDEFKLMNIEVIYWENEPLGKILDYIVEKHHSFVSKTLIEINELLIKILHDNFKTDSELLLKIHRIFGKLKTDMESHQIKEERNLFPLLREYDKNKDNQLRLKIIKYMNDTEDEHDLAGELLLQLNELTDNYNIPEDASYDFRRTYELLDALEKDTFNHIHMENSILFKMI